MKAHLDWRRQLGVLREQLLTTYLPVLVLVGVVTLVAKLTHVPLIDLLKDPAALKEQPFYVGFFSNVGVLLWWAAACVCLFTAALLQRTTALSSSQPVRRAARPAPPTSFFLTAGLISSYLALDDLFLFHDQIFPEYLGVPEKLVLLAIGITLLAFLYTFRHVILRSDVLPLALALTFFVTKELFDQLAELLPTVYSISLVEDYAK
ncbi:MAG: hypothetical protein HY329_20325, partial [Chloroflexi bacterium]|nr:hypothetical protein [Chloroflexota bacterium]